MSVRSEAIAVCALAASNDVFANELTGDKDVERLAYAAWHASFVASNHTSGVCWCEDWAEAEAMLRTGWRPRTTPTAGESKE